MESKLFDGKGNLVYEGSTLNGKAYGVGTAYFADGTKYQEGTFDVKGLVSGKEYYPNGQIRFEGSYRINDAYGPNYPACGDFYLPDGTKAFSGEFKVVRKGLGWPFVIEPSEYGRVVQEGKPSFPVYLWDDAKPSEKRLTEAEETADKYLDKSKGSMTVPATMKDSGNSAEITATEWIKEWLKDGIPDDKFLVRKLREDGMTDEAVMSFIKSFT